ncbi:MULTISPECIES: helix-turn-helix domain-containing protein [Paenarthrobacter]|uniref:Helix-turn-helix domain-containing protein n=1 Tax=Paenarthrobacter ureafaciens TaxID=37931 RepID=A0AAX3EQD4_PAEUR|nr:MULTISPECIES: helix-turn-helix domain-containing protein [Paenarthrobacter]MDO5867084.1 helix-turn-helix domain-containing protein [Paenarthrobacter sp. SD-2]MDO5878253.1 helix-turn-helix domain-containing protein [Paenarthrobacter sp. SD-1]UYV95525.1 helix-turn-helix domain-containing protein [Paenarthrobacter ureafaciens]UYW00126.1 helix-turn-helix domain-containing protein [Paenarthrobacter ureafaciens]
MTDWTNERLLTKPARALDESPCTNLVGRDALSHLVAQLRDELAHNPSSDTAMDLVKCLYLLGSWGKARGSWHDFLAVEQIRVLNLSQNERAPYVQALHSRGLSQRAIAPFLGVSHQTIKNDCFRLELSGTVIGINGKSYAPLPKWHLTGHLAKATSDVRHASTTGYHRDVA